MASGLPALQSRQQPRATVRIPSWLWKPPALLAWLLQRALALLASSPPQAFWPRQVLLQAWLLVSQRLAWLLVWPQRV